MSGIKNAIYVTILGMLIAFGLNDVIHFLLKTPLIINAVKQPVNVNSTLEKFIMKGYAIYGAIYPIQPEDIDKITYISIDTSNGVYHIEVLSPYPQYLNFTYDPINNVVVGLKGNVTVLNEGNKTIILIKK